MKFVLFGLNGRGGMLHYTSQYANALAKKADVTVVLPSYSDDSFFSKKVKIITIPASPNVINFIKETTVRSKHKKLLEEIEKINPDIIHIMDNHPWYINYTKNLKKYKIITTQHDPEMHAGEMFSVRGVVSNKVNKHLRKVSDKIIVHGQKQKIILQKYGVDNKKIIVAHHGTYNFITKYADKRTKEEENTILFFGRIVKYKGIDTLLKANRIILNKKPKIKLIIAGEGNFKPYNKLLEKNVELHNKYLSEKEIAKLFQRSRLVVLPYDEATQSGIIPIAYSFKKPVIATEVGSIPEVMINKKTGLLVSPKNPEELANAVMYLLSRKKETNNMGKEAYKFMKTELNWDTITKKILNKIKK